MTAAPIRFTLTRPSGLTAVVVAIVAGILAWTTALDIRSGTRRIEDLMLAQAQSIADLVTESTGHGLETYRRWEDEITARLMDNARWIARRDSVSRLSDRELAALAQVHRLGRINLFDARGDKTATSRLEEEESLSPRHDPRDFIGPVLRGEKRELRVGFKPARFRGGSRFTVAVARHGGGAVVVNVFADSMQAVLEHMRPHHLLETLRAAKGVRYVRLDTADSVLAALTVTGDTLVSPRDPRYARLLAGGAPLTQELSTSAGEVYEVARRVALPGANDVLLRVGLDRAPLDRARADLRMRAWSRAFVLLLVMALGGGFLLTRQRHQVLQVEAGRMRVELEARERESQRSARLTAMGELAAHVAHEIRNPLNTIHLTAQQLSRDESLGSDVRLAAEDMRAESGRIEGIVQQFLEVARPRRPQLQLVDLGQTALSAGRAARPAFDAAGITLEVTSSPVTASVDADMVGEILDNLLRNAREASPRGARVTLGTARRDGQAILFVEDEGPGVPPEVRERIFDLYYTTKPDGTGLGLSLVSQMAMAMGGGVRLEDRPGGGARFVAHFPEEGART